MTIRLLVFQLSELSGAPSFGLNGVCKPRPKLSRRKFSGKMSLVLYRLATFRKVSVEKVRRVEKGFLFEFRDDQCSSMKGFVKKNAAECCVEHKGLRWD